MKVLYKKILKKIFSQIMRFIKDAFAAFIIYCEIAHAIDERKMKL